MVITDLEGAPLDETAVAIAGRVTGMVADAAHQRSMARAAERVLALHGRLDVLVSNAGIGGEQTPEDIGHLAVFYASAKARMITGQVVAVDGGISVA